MGRLVWTEGSIADLEHIRRYVTAFHPDAARRLADMIAATAATLPPVAEDEIAERAIVFPYLIRYRAVSGDVVVMTVRHSGRARIT